MEFQLSPFRPKRPSTNTQKFVQEVKKLATEVPKGKNKIQLENLRMIQKELESKMMPVDALVDIFDCISRCIESNNYKICIQALKCGQSLATQALQQSRIGTYLPALANLVVEQWGDTKEAVRLQALECAHVIARMSVTARFNIFLRTSSSSLWRTRLVSLHFFARLVEEFGLNIVEQDVSKSICKCITMLTDKRPEIRQTSLDILGNSIYKNVGEVVWDKKFLGSMKFSKTISENLKKRLSTIKPNVVISNNSININNTKTIRSLKKEKKRHIKKGLTALSIPSENVLQQKDDNALISPIQKQRKKKKNRSFIANSTNNNTNSNNNSRNVQSNNKNNNNNNNNGKVTDRKSIPISTPALIPMQIKDQEDLVRQISLLEEKLSTKKENWKARNEALLKLQRIIVNKDVKEMTAYESQIYRLAEALSVQLTELRSSVVRQVCLTLEIVSQNMAADFGVIGERCVPVLLSLTANRIGIISKSADKCLRTIIKSWNGGSVAVLNKIIDATRPKLDRVTRARSQQYLLDSLKIWPRRSFKKEYVKLCEAIFQAITDRSDEVRQLARKSFWALAYHFPKAEQNILRRLSSPDQERLLAEKNNVFTIKEAKEMEQQSRYDSDNEMVQNAINAFDETYSATYVDLNPNMRSFHSKSPVLIKKKGINTKKVEAEENGEAVVRLFKLNNIHERKKKHVPVKDNKNKNHTPRSLYIAGGSTISMKEIDNQFEEQQENIFQRKHQHDNTSKTIGLKMKRYANTNETRNKPNVALVKNTTKESNYARHEISSYLNRHLHSKSNSQSLYQQPQYIQQGGDEPSNIIPYRTTTSKEINEKIDNITTLFESPVWSNRIKAIEYISNAINDLIERQEQRRQQNISSQLRNFMDKTFKAIANKLPDSHHKVTIKILSFLSEILFKEAVAPSMMKNMHNLLPCLFNTLASKRRDVTTSTNQVLNTISAKFNKNELARALCGTLEHRTWESKLAFQDFVLHIIPAASQTFNATNPIRLLLKKLCTNLKIRNVKLQVSCCNVLCALFKGNQKTFFSQVTLMEHNERKLILETMKDKIGDIDEKLKFFVRSSSYAESANIRQGYKSKHVKTQESTDIPACPASSSNNGITVVRRPKDANLLKEQIVRGSSMISPRSLNRDLLSLKENNSSANGNVKILNTLGEILIAAMSKSANSRCDALSSISQISKAKHLKWSHVHSQLVNVTLNALQDGDMSVQLNACDTLCCILNERTKYMYNMLEIVLHRLIHAVDKSVLEIQNALKMTLETMGKVFKPSTFLKCALPILATLNGTPLQMLLNLVSKILPHLASGTLLDALPDIMPQILHAMKHEKAAIRKEAVFCFVEVYFAIGESVMPYFERLSIAQRKLLTIYVEKRKRTNNY